MTASTSRAQALVTALLLAALAFTGLSTVTPSAASAAPAVAENYVLTTPSGGKTFAGSQAVSIGGKTFVGICFDNGLPSPRATAAPELVVTNLGRYQGANFQRLARLHNDDRYAAGKGRTVAAALWAASNLLRSGSAGVDFKRVYDSTYAPQLAKLDPKVAPLLARMLADTAKPLPANTYRFDSIAVTPAQPGRQVLGRGGMRIEALQGCPPECVAAGLLTQTARNTTSSAYRFLVIDKVSRKVLGNTEVKSGTTANAMVRLEDNRAYELAAERWVPGKGWGERYVYGRFTVVCPVPPKVVVDICTVCSGTTVNVELTNTTRRPVLVGVRIGGSAKNVKLAPGASLPRWTHEVTAPTLVRANVQVPGSAVVVTTEMEVRPGRVTPVKVR